MKSWLDKAILSLIGLTFMVMMAWGSRDLVFTGKNDFAPLYNATQLLGTPYLYSAEHNLDLLQKHVGGINLSLRYTRLPYHAAIFWPLGKLPYQQAYLLWVLLGFSAIVGFALLWRVPTPGDAIAFTALSLPAFQSLMNGQDTPLLLLWIALAVHWDRKDRPFLAGCILSLCAAKYHLFTLLPLLFLAQRRWRMAGGFSAGAAVLVIISFAVAGLHWPLEYYHTLIDSDVHPDITSMPNLHGLLFGLPAAWVLQLLASAAVVVAAWIMMKRTTCLYGLATALVGGLLLSYHSYLSDCALLLPAATVIYSQARSRWLQLVCALLLTPFAYFLLINPRPAPYVMQLIIVACFAGAVWQTFRSTVPEGSLATVAPPVKEAAS
jgi:hypothetical protein